MMTDNSDLILNKTYSISKATLDNIEELVDLRKILLSQGSHHYTAKSIEDDLAWQASYRSWLRKHIKESTKHINVVVIQSLEGGIVGCAIGVVDDRAPCCGCLNGLVGWVQSVIVAPEFRGNGLAQEAMKFLFEWFRSQHVTKIALQATPFASSMYERIGFINSGEDLLIKVL